MEATTVCVAQVQTHQVFKSKDITIKKEFVPYFGTQNLAKSDSWHTLIMWPLAYLTINNEYDV